MPLLPVHIIQSELALKYVEQLRLFPDAFEPFAPRPPNPELAQAASRAIENACSVVLPLSFRDAILQWNLSSCEIASITFSRGRDYSQQVTKYNANIPGIRWWEDRDVDIRPVDELMIASGDPWIVLLHCSSGNIFTYDSELGSARSELAAGDLERFLRGLGTIALRRRVDARSHKFVESLMAAVGASPDCRFWRTLAEVCSDA